MSIARTTSQLVNDILLDGNVAANADLMGSPELEPDPSLTATGWDSFEVWRKLIKEARDKRHTQ